MARKTATNRIRLLELGSVSLPAAHPRAHEQTCIVNAFAVVNPEGVILVDTGLADDHPLIVEMYRPVVRSIDDELHRVGIDERDVLAIVNTHLHFDHCGQNRRFPDVPVWVTADELDASKGEFYTVPEWATISAERLRLSNDGEEIAPGVGLIHTPGHTPGHQSVMVQTESGTEIVVGQACYDCGEFTSGRPAGADMHDQTWIERGADSLRRLRASNPDRAHFSHDRATFTPSRDPSGGQ